MVLIEMTGDAQTVVPISLPYSPTSTNPAPLANLSSFFGGSSRWASEYNLIGDIDPLNQMSWLQMLFSLMPILSLRGDK